MLGIDVLEALQQIDKVLTSKDPTVVDAFQQALVLTKVVEPDRIKFGPLEQMWRELVEMRRELEQLKRETARYTATGSWNTYTTTTADTSGYWREPDLTNYGATGSIGKLTNEEIEKYLRYPIDTTVVPALPTEPNAFTMFDPDTGDSMSVKYK
jgi:hypothetical protein